MTLTSRPVSELLEATAQDAADSPSSGSSSNEEDGDNEDPENPQPGPSGKKKKKRARAEEAKKRRREEREARDREGWIMNITVDHTFLGDIDPIVSFYTCGKLQLCSHVGFMQPVCPKRLFLQVFWNPCR